MSATTDLDRLMIIERELLRRHCRVDLLDCATEILAPRDEAPAAHHRLICHHLQQLSQRKIKRLMILAPPGSAKTTYTSRIFPAWFFADHPRANIIAVSHTQELAETNSSFVQRIVKENPDLLGYHLNNDAKGRWYTDNGCGYLAGSVGSAILGFRADLAIIDDPIKSRQDAESEISREHVWTWYTNDLLTRLTPEGVVVLIATPFHEDDLMGRLLRIQPDAWQVLRLPAIAEEDPLTPDPLGRAPGQPLWNDDAYGYGSRLLEIYQSARDEGRTRDWYAMYQGRPRPPEGAMFKPQQMPIVSPDLTPKIIQRVRAWDLASSTKTSSDWTAGVLLGSCYAPGRFDIDHIILDVIRFRGTPEEVRRTIIRVAEADTPATKIWIPRDPAQAGVDQAESYIRMLRGFRVETERVSGDKATRADAAAAQANIGRISILKAPWNPWFIEELASFPMGQHDDAVDALSLAYSKLENKSRIAQWLRL